MIGRHIFPVTEPGDYGKPNPRPAPRGFSTEMWARQMAWQVVAPDGSSVMLNPAIHTVELHADNTITVTPSIVTPTWHGWLKAGVWTSV